jgi:enoyl-CoA hydratase
MSRQFVDYVNENGIVVVTVNRPPVNALNSQLIKELIEIFDELENKENVSVVILTGAGKAFIAGADIKEIPSLNSDSGRKFSALAQKLTSQIDNFPQPVICAIEGLALGGGCEVALACDIRVASENAKFGQPEVNLGVIAGAGGTQRLPRLVGKGKAKMLLFTGEMIDAQEAFQIGLVEKVVSAGNALKEAKEIAKKIMAKGPVAVSLTKKAVNEGMNLSLIEGLKVENYYFGKVCETEDKNEGVKAFLEKRKPIFQGK